MNRREFTELIIAGVSSTVGGSYVVARTFMQSMLSLPRTHEDTHSFGVLKPGWIENMLPNREHFFALENLGHRKFVEYICENTKLLRSILFQAYSYLLSDEIPERPPTLAEYFRYFFDLAREVTIKMYGVEPSADEVAHVAMYAISHITHPHLEEDRDGTFANKTELFGVALPIDQDERRRKFHRGYLFKTPHILPYKVSGRQTKEAWLTRIIGWDRCVHAVQFMFVHFMYRYSLESGTDDYKHMHRWMSSLVPKVLPVEVRQTILNFIITHGWESKETIDMWIAKYLEGKKTIAPNGYDDPLWEIDAAANRLGKYLGDNLGIGKKQIMI